MEDTTKDRGLRLTTLQRYVKAYGGNITFSVHDNQGQLVAEFSSAEAERPDENSQTKKTKASEPAVA